MKLMCVCMQFSGCNLYKQSHGLILQLWAFGSQTTAGQDEFIEVAEGTELTLSFTLCLAASTPALMVPELGCTLPFFLLPL